jgi:hypothetical protein
MVCCLSLISFSSFLSSAPYGAAPYVFSTWMSLLQLSRRSHRGSVRRAYSSVRGVIFFSSTSSSAKFFWYFSQLWPVAEGMIARRAAAAGVRVGRVVCGMQRRCAGEIPRLAESGEGRRGAESGWQVKVVVSSGAAMMAMAGGLRRSELGSRCQCPGRVPPHQNNSGYECCATSPATTPNVPLSLPPYTHITHHGRPDCQRRQRKCRVQGAPRPARAGKLQTNAGGRTRRSRELCAAPILLRHEVWRRPSPAAELRTDAQRTAVADAIRTVCPTTRCGEQPWTNTRAVAGTQGHGQDGRMRPSTMTRPRR